MKLVALLVIAHLFSIPAQPHPKMPKPHRDPYHYCQLTNPPVYRVCCDWNPYEITYGPGHKPTGFGAWDCNAGLAQVRRRSVVLVTPQGRPVGGRMQLWVDESLMPTPAVRVTVDSGRYLCAGAPNAAGAACSSAGPPWELAAYDRDSLYFELGHIFDAAYLKGWQRAYFARRWGRPHAHWNDSSWALGEGLEDGLMADFARVYADCAAGQKDQGLIVGVAPPVYTGPWACQFIQRVS